MAKITFPFFDRLFLRLTPAGRGLAVQNLRPAAAVDLPSIFNHFDVHIAWERPTLQIRRLFGTPDEIPGSLNPGDRRALYYLVAALQPMRVLEVGTHVGGGTLALALGLAAHVPGGSLTSVDPCDVNGPRGPWKKLGLPFSPAAMLSTEGLHNTSFVTRPALSFFQGAGEPYDLIVLDGDKGAAATYWTIQAALQRLSPGGVIVLADYFPNLAPLYSDTPVVPGPFLALERLTRENPELTALPLGSLPWVTRFGSTMSALALLVRTA